MKAFILVLITSLFLFSSITCATTCDTYKCSSFTLPAGLCSVKQSDATLLKRCGSGQTCSGSIGVDFTRQYCVEPIKKKFVNETCNLNDECLTNKCVDNKCGQNSPCITSLDCGLNQNCYIFKCVYNLAAGDTCFATSNCPANQICSSFKCKTVHSIEVGDASDSAMLCKSELLEDGLCAESELTSSPKCTSNDDCKIKITFNGKKADKFTTGTCKCSYDGNKYCSITTKTQEWQDYLYKYQKAEAKALSNNILIDYLRNNYWGDQDLAHAAKKKNQYPEFKEVDSCAERYLLNAFYMKVSLLSLLALIFVLA